MVGDGVENIAHPSNFTYPCSDNYFICATLAPFDLHIANLVIDSIMRILSLAIKFDYATQGAPHPRSRGDTDLREWCYYA